MNFHQRLTDNFDRFCELIDRFFEPNILVIGDLTLDEFLVGRVERISREAPVLILRHEHTNQVPGGGANAVYNLAKLGAKVRVAGIIGDDIQGTALKGIFEDAGINTHGMLIDSTRPTVTKTRISGHSRQSVTQQMVRLDRKSDDLPPAMVQQELANYIESQINQVDAVVCSDYGDGVFSEVVIKAALKHPRCIVDTQSGLDRYLGATIFTPNLPEAENAVGYSINNNLKVTQAGEDLLKLTQSTYMLITRGDEGMSLFTNEQGQEKEQHIPPFNRTDVFDVTGAGDTVVSALTLALCVGATPWEAAVLGNLAASIVIRQVGTATTSPDEMKETLVQLIVNS